MENSKVTSGVRTREGVSPGDDLLTLEHVRRIGLGLLPLGEQSHELAEAMRQAGFSAFVPYQRFIESFAASPADLVTHREYVIERAKAIIADAEPSLVFTEHGERIYQSKFIAELSARAARSAMARDPSTEWIARNHPDPCEQQSFLLKLKYPKDYERRYHAMLEQRTNQLVLESKQHATGVSARHPLGMLLRPQRFHFAALVIERETVALGFKPTGLNAARGDVVVFRPIHGNWVLGWAMRDPDLFWIRPREGDLALHLVVCSRDYIRVARAQPRSWAAWRYGALVDGFSTAYRVFSDLDVLETMIKAHIHLYSLIAPTVQLVVADSLGGG